jgi:glutathione S-transferase
MTRGMSITFFYSPQSSATRIHWTLEELGVPYEKVKLDLRAGDQRKPDYLAINPNGKVPAVVLDGTPVFESSAIQIVLGERFGVEKGLWPAAGTPERAQALSWLLWGHVTLGAAFMRYFMNTGSWIPPELQHKPQAEAALKEIHANLALLDARLNGREYVVGDRSISPTSTWRRCAGGPSRPRRSMSRPTRTCRTGSAARRPATGDPKRRWPRPDQRRGRCSRRSCPRSPR